MLRLHNDILTQISTQISQGRQRHFYLLTGDEGIGKRTTARYLAKHFLCASPYPEGACGTCKSCHMFEAGTNADYINIEPDGNSILIESTRRMNEDMYIRPIYSKRKAVVIADAHKMTNAAQNSILKTIEEPPEYAVIIMTSIHREMLLQTINSRASHFMLKPQDHDIIRALLDTSDEFAIGYGAGNIGMVKKCLQNEFAKTRKNTISLLEQIIFREYANISESDHMDVIDDCLEIMLVMLRDVYLLKKGVEDIVNKDIMTVLIQIAQKAKNSEILRYVKSIGRAQRLLDINTNKRAVFYNFIYGG